MEKSLAIGPPALSLIMTFVLIFPAFLTAAGPDFSKLGQAQKFQDPVKLRRAVSSLLQKAGAQTKIINDWHRKARLKAAQTEAKNRNQTAKRIATGRSRVAPDSVKAMPVAPNTGAAKPMQNLFGMREQTKALSNLTDRRAWQTARSD